MTTSRSMATMLALAGVLAMTACTAPSSADRPVPTDSSTPVAVAAIADGDGSLRIATVLDQAGEAGVLASAQVAGVQLAVREINEQGGVAGSDVTVVHRSTATDATALLQDLAARGIDLVLWGAQPDVPAAIADPLAGTATVLVRLAEPSATPDEAFAARLRSADPGIAAVDGGAEAYDATVRIALAALAGGNDSGASIAAHLGGVATGSFPCTSYGECAAAIADGAGIRYAGATGTADSTTDSDAPVASDG